MLHPAAPGHLRDVDQTFDARLELDKGAVIGDAHHAADHAAVRRIVLHRRHHGSGASCFMPSEMRSLSLSNFRTLTVISSPTFTTSEGCVTRP